MSLKIEGNYEKPTWTQGFKNEPESLWFLPRIEDLPSLKPDKPLVSYDKPDLPTSLLSKSSEIRLEYLLPEKAVSPSISLMKVNELVSVYEPKPKNKPVFDMTLIDLQNPRNIK